MAWPENKKILDLIEECESYLLSIGFSEFQKNDKYFRAYGFSPRPNYTICITLNSYDDYKTRHRLSVSVDVIEKKKVNPTEIEAALCSYELVEVQELKSLFTRLYVLQLYFAGDEFYLREDNPA